MASTLTLFLVAHVSFVDNYDLLVWAKSKRDAVRLWNRYYEFTRRSEPSLVWRIPTNVPEKACALVWSRDVMEVGGRL